MRELFLFLSSTKTNVSKVVGLFTKSKTTHSALCLNGKFDNMYTFGRKTLKPFPAGFVHENVRKNMLAVQGDCYCEVYRLEIEEKNYQSLLAVRTKNNDRSSFICACKLSINIDFIIVGVFVRNKLPTFKIYVSLQIFCTTEQKSHSPATLHLCAQKTF